MPDHVGLASPVHRDGFIDISQCGPLSQLEPQHYTNMLGQPNLGSECPAPSYAPGTWEDDTIK
eukprot:2424474-Karenia_brevis.AAC.1